MQKVLTKVACGRRLVLCVCGVLLLGGVTSRAPVAQAADTKDVAARAVRGDAAKLQALRDAIPSDPPFERLTAIGVPRPDPRDPIDYWQWFNDCLPTSDGPSSTPFYWRARDYHVPWDGDEEVISDLRSGTRLEDLAEAQRRAVQTWLLNNELAVFYFQEAGRRGPRTDGLWPRTEGELLLDVWLEPNRPHRDLATAIAIRAEIAAAEGRHEEALEACFGLIRNAHHFRQRLLNMEILIGISIEAIAFGRIGSILDVSHQDFDLVAVRERFASVSTDRRDVPELFVETAATISQLVQESFAPDPRTGALEFLPEVFVPVFMRLEHVFMGPEHDRQKMVPAFARWVGAAGFEHHARQTDLAIEYAIEAYATPWPETPAAAEEYSAWLMQHGNFLNALLVPDLVVPKRLNARMESMRLGTILLIDILEYRRVHGRPPESLDEVNAPLDPSTAQPYHYARDGYDFELYSVGADGLRDAEDAERSDDVIFWPVERAGAR